MKSRADDGITIDNTLFSIPNCEGAVVALSMVEGVGSLQSIAEAPPEAVSRFIAAATAKATRLAYTSDLADFRSFGGDIPSDPAFLATYIAARAEYLSPHTITRRVVAISRAHRALGLVDPCKSDLIRTMLRGIRRTKGTKQRQAAALLPEDLFAMLPLLRGTRGARDKALLTLSFSGALRRSEVVSLNVEDVTFVKEGLLLYLRSSKTDQEGKGRSIAIPKGRTNACPVAAVENWLEVAGIKQGALFRQVRKDGTISENGLSAQSVCAIVKSRVSAIGLSPSNYSGHSLRAGFVTSAARAGRGAPSIMRQTGHRSVEMVNRYIRNATLFDDNAAALLL